MVISRRFRSILQALFVTFLWSTSWVLIKAALVNTALAFILWNRSLQNLSAVESNVINDTMLVQIALLAWLFLGEQLALREVFGLILAAGGILIASLKSR